MKIKFFFYSFKIADKYKSKATEHKELAWIFSHVFSCARFFFSSIFSARILTLTLTLGHCPTNPPPPPPPPPNRPQKVTGCKERHAIALL